MDVKILFARMQELWPSVIDISRKNADGNDITFWSLIDIYDRIESDIQPDDDWTGVSAWAFHQALMELAGIAAVQNISSLHVPDVPLPLFDRFLRENLSDPSWENERAAYIKQNGLSPISSA